MDILCVKLEQRKVLKKLVFLQVSCVLSMLFCLLLSALPLWAADGVARRSTENGKITIVPSRLQTMQPSQPLSTPIVPQRPAPQVFPQEEEEGLAEDMERQPKVKAPAPVLPPAAPLKAQPIKKKPLFLPLSADVLSRADKSLEKEPEATVNLPELMTKILQSHPDLELAATYVLEKEGDSVISKAQRYPKVALDVISGPQVTDYIDPRKPSTLDYGSASLTVSQTIFDFGAVKRNILSSKYSRDGAELQLRKAVNDLAFAVGQFYLDVLQAQESVHIRRNEVAFYRALHEAYSMRHNAGESFLSDVQKMSVSLKRAESSLVSELQRLKVAKDTLETLLGGEKLGFFAVYPQLFIKTMNAGLDDLLAQGEKTNLSLISMQKEVLSAENKIASLQKDKLPKIGYKLSGGMQSKEDELTDNYGVQLTFSWTITDGGEKTGQIMKLNANLRRNKAMIRSEKNAMSDRIKTAYNDYLAATRDLELAREAKNTSLALTNNYFQEIDLGVRTLLDLVSAKEGEVEAEMRENVSRFRRVRGLMRLYLEVGLLPHFLPVSEYEVKNILASLGITPSVKFYSTDESLVKEQ